MTEVAASNSMSVWIKAFRLRTLPLALASIGMGSFLAASQSAFRLEVFIWAALTTIFLQILSNLANDYGDSVHGADGVSRKGPSRAVQSGAVTKMQMKAAIGLFGILSFASGIYLLYISTGLSTGLFWLFLALGLLSIAAAITYTAGARPYGYMGLGDVSVVVFFGLIGVLGTFFLHAQYFLWQFVLPALSCGFFATGVLNLNNIRDINSDKKAGKLSIPVRLGRRKAVVYHWVLLTTGMICAIIFTLVEFKSIWQFLFIATMPLFVINAKAVQQKTEPADLDPYLKQLALSTLLFVITFGLGQLLG